MSRQSQAAKIYAETRERTCDLVRGLPAADVARRLPATPLWSPRDVVAHLTGVGADTIARKMDGAPGDAWTAAQVESRRSLTLEEVLEEWTDVAATVEERLEDIPYPWGPALLADIATHEQDIRGGVGRSGGRDSAAVKAALRFFLFPFRGRVESASLPSLLVRGDEEEWVAGAGHPAVSVTATDFDLLRALSGRRSARQIAAFNWEGDPAPYIGLFPLSPIFQMPASAILE